MSNMEIYSALQSVPANAKREITAGRLKGKTDINPMWRIKALTEQFGPCGIGWKYVITDKRLEEGAKGEIAAFLDIDLFVKVDGAWSEAIPGTGGSAFVASERNGLYTSDECFKMALTDAISVACKALGMGADVYWQADSTKYDAKSNTQAPTLCASCGKPITGVRRKDKSTYTAGEIIKNSKEKYGAALCWSCCKKRAQEDENHG